MIEFLGIPLNLENHKMGLPWKPCIFTYPIPSYILGELRFHFEGPIEQFGMNLKGPWSAG